MNFVSTIFKSFSELLDSSRYHMFLEFPVTDSLDVHSILGIEYCHWFHARKHKFQFATIVGANLSVLGFLLHRYRTHLLLQFVLAGRHQCPQSSQPVRTSSVKSNYHNPKKGEPTPLSQYS